MKLEKIMEKLMSQIDVSYFLKPDEFLAMKKAMQTPIAQLPVVKPTKKVSKS